MNFIDGIILDLTERLCRRFQLLTGRTNVWLAVQLTNLSIVVYFVWAFASFLSSDLPLRVLLGGFCAAVLYGLTQTVLKVPVETYEQSAFLRAAKGLRNPRRIRDALLRIVFLTLTLFLAVPTALVYVGMRLPIVLLGYSLIVLTTLVLYVLACDPLPPCEGMVLEWLRRLAPLRRRIGPSTMRKIDLFTHVMPAPYHARLMAVAPDFADVGKRMRNVPMLTDLDLRFRVMDGFEGYQQVLSLPTPPIEVMASGSAAVDLARAANDGMAELVSRHPSRFPGFVASLPLGDPDAAVTELGRAIEHLGARGVQVFSNVNGAPLTTPGMLPIFEAMAGYDLPLWLHPYRGPTTTDYKTEERSQFEIWWTFGWPYETSVAMSRIVFAGLFDRWPGLKIITHHMGAMAPYFAGRVGPGWDQLGVRTTAPDGGEALQRLRKRPVDYFHMFYADTALFGAYDATVCGLAFFGADKVVFASDAPFDPEGGPMYIRETIAIVDRLPITEAERAQIYAGNAIRLLRLEG